MDLTDALSALERIEHSVSPCLAAFRQQLVVPNMSK
jgi:hypothetical protein